MADAKQPRRIANFSQAMVYTIVVIAILVVVNFLANRYNKSFDATANKRYTLSDQSAKIAGGLDQDLTIRYWDRPEAFPNARGLFDRYENLSSRIKIVYEDIDKNPTQAIAAGVTAPGTIQIQVGNKTELAKSLTEEEVTGAMVRAIKGGDRTVCFTANYGEADAADPNQNGYSSVKELTDGNNFKTKPVPLIPVPTIPPDCTILVAGGPTRDYLQPAVDAIKTYVENGGRALFLLDPPIKFPNQQVDDNAALVSMLESWGIKVNKDLVLDLSGVGQVFRMGPEFVVVSGYGQHPIVRDMTRVATGFPLVRSVEASNTDKTEAAVLFGTSDAAVSITDLTNPQIRVEAGKEGEKNLAAAGTYNTGKENSEGRFVVVGSSRWINNGFLNFNGNRDLYLNMLNWLSADEELISIRPKDPEDRRLNMNASQVTLLFWGSVVGLPLLFVIAGVGVWWRRR